MLITDNGDEPSDEIRQGSNPKDADEKSQRIQAAPSFATADVRNRQEKDQVAQPHDVPVEFGRQ